MTATTVYMTYIESDSEIGENLHSTAGIVLHFISLYMIVNGWYILIMQRYCLTWNVERLLKLAKIFHKVSFL
jgi:hypothetical protein